MVHPCKKRMISDGPYCFERSRTLGLECLAQDLSSGCSYLFFFQVVMLLCVLEVRMCYSGSVQAIRNSKKTIVTL